MGHPDLKLREKLRRLLTEAGITAAELARRSGVPKQTLSDWLAGTPPRSMTYIRQVADVFGCSMDELLFDASAPEPPTRPTSQIEEVLKAIPDMIGYWDAQLKNVYANEAYMIYFGMSPEAILGKSLAEVLGPELFAKNLPYVKGALEGRVQVFEREIPTPSGQIKRTIAKYLPDIVDGKVRGFSVVVADISDIK